MERLQLREKLIIIKNNNFELVQGETIGDYLEHMMCHIGDLDPVLRDHLILPTMVQWIEIKKMMDKNTMSHLFDTLLSEDYIFYNIGQIDDTSVYKRSFSTLTLNPILEAHEAEPFLTEGQLDHFRNRMIEYIEKEHDFRGYDENHGWAHAFAHWSDTNYYFTFEMKEPREMSLKVLDIIQTKLMSIDTPLAREEDERLATNIVYSYIGEKMITLSDFKMWLEKFNDVFEIEDKILKYTVRINVKHFLRSLYFRMRHLNITDGYMNPLIELEKKFNIYLY
ncbi:MAG: DUF2785 domain-containing protein [Clostridiales bacterium]|nr:DUF2785 domain-containing protein [Clostridiales bacterium]